ncbi:hypothetical protein D3C84_1010370 [compost metagenome]
MEAQAVVALEGRFDLVEELAIGEQTRHFVLVLDRQHLEVIASHSFGQCTGLAGQGNFRGAEPCDAILVTLGVGCILVLGEEVDASRDSFFQALRELVVAANDFACFQLALYPR